MSVSYQAMCCQPASNIV